MLIRLFFLTLMVIGLITGTLAVKPVIDYKIWEFGEYHKNALLVSPMADQPVDSSVLGISLDASASFPSFVGNQNTVTTFAEFEIKTPALGSLPLKVKVNSNDFAKEAAHLPGSALPGEVGNVFITAHSGITSFGQQKALFSNLPKVKKGDLISVSANNQNFTYEVLGLKIVDPQDTSVLNPPNQVDRFLTLMTCVPPGFNTQRLIVLSRLKI